MDVLKWARSAVPGAKVEYASRRWGATSDRRALETAYEAAREELIFVAQRHEEWGVVYEATRISARTAKMLAAQPGRMGIRLWGRAGSY